jgi:hypothetical protein
MFLPEPVQPAAQAVRRHGDDTTMAGDGWSMTRRQPLDQA